MVKAVTVPDTLPSTALTQPTPSLQCSHITQVNRCPWPTPTLEDLSFVAPGPPRSPSALSTHRTVTRTVNPNPKAPLKERTLVGKTNPNTRKGAPRYTGPARTKPTVWGGYARPSCRKHAVSHAISPRVNPTVTHANPMLTRFRTMCRKLLATLWIQTNWVDLRCTAPV